MLKTYARKEYEIPDAHPAANCLPWNLDGPDFTALIESVKTEFDGMKPIMVQAGTGLIIDGRRRLLACAIAEVDPVMKDYDMTDSEVIEYVGSHELSGRNLTPEQYAATEVDLAELKGKGKYSRENKGEARGPAGPYAKTHQQIADSAGVGKKTVDRLAKLKKSAPELLDTVKEKKLPVNTAVRAAEELTPKQVKQIANADDPKADAKKLLGPEKPKPAKPPKAADDPTRGGNNFDYGENAKTPEPVEVVEAEDPGKAFVAELEETCREIDRLKARIESWKSNPLVYTTHWQSHVANLESVRKSIWQGRPCHVCPYCDGEKCDTCKKTGRVQKSTYKSGCEAMGKDAAA